MAKNEELKQILRGYASAYKWACDNSRDTLIDTMKPGTPLPQEGRIYGDAFRDQFKKDAAGYRDRALKIVDDEIKAINAKLTAAPSTDAVNSIMMLRMKQNITRADIDRLVSAYGSNPLAYDTIRSIAFESGIRDLPDNPLTIKAERLADVRSSIEKTMTIHQAEAGHIGDGFFSMAIDPAIDDALGE